MAEGRGGGTGDHSATVPLAHGGTEGGAAESEPPGERSAGSIKCGKLLKILAFCMELWYN